MSDWKNSPIIAAIASGSAVLTLTLHVVFTYAIPIIQTDQVNEINKLKDDKKHLENNLKKTSSELDGLKRENIENIKKIKNHQAEVNKLNANFLEYSYHNSFQNNTPYPIGYGKVKPGDFIDKIFENYKLPEIRNDEKGKYYEVSPVYGIIGGIRYYVDDKTKLVTHISFEKRKVNYSYSERNEYETLEAVSLGNILDNVFGKAKQCDDENYKYWTIKEAKIVMYSVVTDTSYLIYDNPYRPAVWPDECVIAL